MPYRNFAPHDNFPADFPNALGQVLSGLAFNFRVNIKPGAPTVLQVVAASDLGRVAIAVQGRWRYVDTTVERASPGGAAQTFDVYVTASDNNFAISGDHEVDSTNYSFALAIVTAGTAPSGVALYSRVATAKWNGTQFASVTPVVPLWRAGEVSPGDLKFSRQTADHGVNPDGGGAAWLLFNTASRSVSAATYPGLWDALGMPALSGGNFSLGPSPAGRTLVGAGSGGTDDHGRVMTARSPGDVFGEEVHELLAAESGVNGDGVAYTRHNAIVEYTGDPGSVDGYIGQAPQFWGINVNQTETLPLYPRDADSAHENTQPSLALNCFIRT